MNSKTCTTCNEDFPENAFRQGSNDECVWCQWDSSEKRARARHKDKLKNDKARALKAASNGNSTEMKLQISEEDFVSWYVSSPDTCHYCGISMAEVKKLRLRRGGFGYFVSWDIDRKDSNKPYQAGNLALSCFMCNMAKGAHFTEAEAKTLGQAIRSITQERLKL